MSEDLTIDFEGILNSLSDIVLVKDTDSKLLWGNKAFHEFYGTTEATLRGQLDKEESDPDHTLRYVRDDRFVAETQTHLRILEPAKTAEGEVTHIDTIKSPVLKDGKVVQTVGVSRAPRHEDEKVSSTAEGKNVLSTLTQFVKSFPLPVALLNIHGQVVYWSNLWEKYWSKVRRVDQYVSFMNYTSSNNPEVTEQLEKVLRKPQELVIQDLQIELPTGPRFIDLNFHPWFFTDGVVGGNLVLVRDHTAKRERLAQIEYQARSLKKANKSLNNFVRAASHELKAPLRAIRNLSTWLVEDFQDELPKESLKSIDEIDRRVETMQNLLEGLLQHYQIGEARSRPEEFKFVDLRQEVTNQLQIPEDFSIDWPADDLSLFTDFLPLALVLRNLLENAIRFNHRKEGAKVEVILEKTEKRSLKIIVRDNGPGIPSALRHKVFGLFTSAKNHSESTGIGLALVEREVTVRGGTVIVQDNRSSGGAEFRIDWPLERSVGLEHKT